jgi:hypothetical protein
LGRILDELWSETVECFNAGYGTNAGSPSVHAPPYSPSSPNHALALDNDNETIPYWEDLIHVSLRGLIERSQDLEQSMVIPRKVHSETMADGRAMARQQSVAWQVIRIDITVKFV